MESGKIIIKLKEKVRYLTLNLICKVGSAMSLPN